MLVQLPLVGPESVSRSALFNAQKTVNFYPVIDNESSYGSALFSRPGLTNKATIAGIGWGMAEWKGDLYGVWGTSIYKVDSNFNATLLGALSGAGFVTFARSSTQIAIARNDTMAIYDGTTFSTVGDAEAVTFLNQKFIIAKGGNTFATSNLLDAETYNSLNEAAAESHFDDLVAPFAFKEFVYMFGKNTIESWYDSGVGNPPLDRYTGGLINIGTPAKASIAANDNFVYFLGDDSRVYRLNGVNHQEVSTKNIAFQLSQHDDLSGAKGFTLTYDGQNFYVLVLTSVDKTYVYSESANSWALWESNYGRFNGNDYAFAFNKHLIQGKAGDLYEFDHEVYTDDGSEIIRERRGIQIHSGLIPGAGSKQIFLHGIRLIMQAGNGAVSGQGVTPEIMLRISDNGGRSWSESIPISTGALGDYDYRVEWFGLGAYFYSGMIELTCSDPVDWNLYELHADIELGRH